MQPLREDDPRAVSQYVLSGRLGEGGMGTVYLGADPAGQLVAVKVIRPELAGHEDFRARFRTEVATARKVARFCTAPILDADTEADPPYIVSEYIDGPALGEVVRDQGPLTGSQLHGLAVGIATALAAIHHAGVVHRDLKPGNVLLSRFGAQVIDFGIARAVGAVSNLTQPGRLIGSPSFMAPEQLRGDPVTPKADIFAWGSVLAYAGTGVQPFGSSMDGAYYQVLYGDPVLDGLDPDLAGLVRWALAKDPQDRPDAPTLLGALVRSGPGGEPQREPEPVSPRRAGGSHAAPRGPRRGVRWLVVLAAALVLAAAGAGAIWTGLVVNRQHAVAALDGYLGLLKTGKFDAAYGRLCTGATAGASRADFVRIQRAAPAILRYRIDQSGIPTRWTSTYPLTVEVRRADGTTRAEHYAVQQTRNSRPDQRLICPR
jgi:predicted Ser/Thr protein kinase